MMTEEGIKILREIIDGMYDGEKFVTIDELIELIKK